MSQTIQHTYYAYKHNAEECLKNGSFVRRSKYGLGQFTLGDFVGFIEAVPEGMAEIDSDIARSIIPECCR